VAGLNQDAPVKYNGVDVGKVREIRLDPANPQRVRLLLAIERGTPVRQDTVAMLRIQGLTGIAYMELSGGSQGAPRLVANGGDDYPVIQTRPSLSARLETVLTTAMAKLESTSNHVDALLSDDNLAAFKSTLADLATVARTVAARKDAIDKGMTDATRTLDNTARAASQLGPVMDRVGRSADAIEAMGNSVTLTSTSAGKAVDAVGMDVKRFGAETLPELERLLGELSVLATSLRRLSEQTERDPRGLLFGRKPVPPGPGEAGAAGAAP
jgi:phospholipid/cholesterol/gamma-HCH transport system substrate-binding protein